MRRSNWAILLAALLSLLTGCDPVQGTGDTDGNQDTVAVKHVVDGDTIELVDGRKIRYLGVNTPEHGRPYYEEAKLFNANLVANKAVRLEFDLETIDQYGRALAHVFVGETHVNLELIVHGYASVYTVPPNVKYSQKFLAAQREARENERGLWARSDALIRITGLNPIEEWLEITNQGNQPIDLTGYTLKDEANHIYKFDGFILAGKHSVHLYSGNGRDTASELFWGLGEKTVWNNGGDTAYLRDPEGSLADLYTY
jgi:endonuclease YncB( thermonuclease family)